MTTPFTWVKCCTCKVDFVLPQALYDAGHHSGAIHFWCPYGHRLQFDIENTTATKKEEVKTTQGQVHNGGFVTSMKSNVVKLFDKKKDDVK